MARTPNKPPMEVTTPIGVLSGGEKVALDTVGVHLFLTARGKRIAKRLWTKGAKRWVPMKKGWAVFDTADPLALRIMHDGVEVHWTPKRY
jgi:hypothetical protein